MVMVDSLEWQDKTYLRWKMGRDKWMKPRLSFYGNFGDDTRADQGHTSKRALFKGGSWFTYMSSQVVPMHCNVLNKLSIYAFSVRNNFEDLSPFFKPPRSFGNIGILGFPILLKATSPSQVHLKCARNCRD